MIRLSDISVAYESELLSFWSTSRPISYERECIVMDLKSGREAGRVSGNVTSSRIIWQTAKGGAFVQRKGAGELGAWVLTVVELNDYSMRTDFPLPGGSTDLLWLSDHELAFTMIMPNKEGYSVESPATDLFVLNIDDGQLQPMTQRGDIAGPLCLVNDDLWCVRMSDRERCVYSATSHRDVWCMAEGCFLDIVTDADERGSVLILMIRTSVLQVLLETLRHPHSIMGIAPLLISRWARPTRASVVDAIGGDTLWCSRPWHVLSGALGSDGKVALSVEQRAGRWAIMEYRPPDWEQRVIATSRKPLLVVADSKRGWIVLEGNKSLLLATQDGTETIYETSDE